MKITSRARRAFGRFALAALSPVLLFARPHDVNLELETLTLLNGRSYGKCVLRSYDPDNGRVVFVEQRNMVSVQLELLPKELAERVVALVPAADKDAAREAKDRELQRQRAADKQNTARNAERAKQNRTEDRQSADRAAESEASQLASRLKANAKQAVYVRARRYFSYEYKPGSGSVAITRGGLELDEPEDVPGWDRRMRVSGTVGLEFYDSYGGSFNRTTRSFEALVEGSKNGSVKIIDFALK